MTDTKKNYKDSLNLPKTSFPMKANLSQNEPQSLKRWAAQNLYQTMLDTHSDRPEFCFHDGPPYANGSIHIGHLLNKVLKDIVVRSQNQFGKRCAFIPGWDCHGLPIEHKVMTEIVSQKKEKFQSLSDEVKRIAIRGECAKYAQKYIKLQSEQMKRLLTLADYDNPYLTMDPKYEEAVLGVFARLVGEGIVYRQLKPVHWSIANQTALAEAELEYYDKEDTAVYVDFNCVDSEQVSSLFNCDISGAVSLTIWTTTPWTLPANLAVSAHKELTYALCEFDGVYRIVATSLLETVSEKCGVTGKVLGEVKGAALEGVSYQHPFCDRIGKVALADYVTAEDGTGLVHTAPGHGLDDYLTGLKEGLDVYCPVQSDGTYDDSVPDWLNGLSIWDANDIVVKQLESSKHLCAKETFMHSYPHDWRSKTPVIFRSTEQWFVSVDQGLNSSGTSLREMALSEIDSSIQFVPDWGQKRLRGMLEARPDWCLSRQRSWGLPIPAFRTSAGDVFLTKASVMAVSKVIGEEGSDAWFKQPADVLLKYYDASQDPDANGVDVGSLEKMFDIFDVWFESGSSWNAVLRRLGQSVPADLYLEGSDQHRGWFHLSLLPALGVMHQAPFKGLLTHGFVVDKDGRKMSKSGGNALNVDDILAKYGAEVTRWWVSSLSFENDIKVDMSFFDVAGDGYRKIRNTIRFLLSNIFDLDLSQKDQFIADIENVDPCSVDGYILGETLELERRVQEVYHAYSFRTVNQLLYQFCNETLSSFYCVAVKDRLYCDTPDSQRRVQSQKVIWYVLEVLLRLLAPILPHTADEAYHALHQNQEGSVILLDPISLNFTPSDKWSTLLSIRSDVLKALEDAKAHGVDNTLDAGVQLSDKEGALTPFMSDLSDLFGVSRVSIIDGVDAPQILDLREEPRCERSWRRDETVKERSDGTWLSDRDAIAVGVN